MRGKLLRPYICRLVQGWYYEKNIPRAKVLGEEFQQTTVDILCACIAYGVDVILLRLGRPVAANSSIDSLPLERLEKVF
jgi:hypothetical protein